MSQAEFQKLPIRSFGANVPNTPFTNFAIEKLSEDALNAGIQVDAHRHDYYHVLYVEEGSGMHTIDFITYEVKSHQLYFVSPGQVHSLVLNPGVKAFVISFDSHFYALNSDLQKLLDFPFFHSLNNLPFVQVKNCQNEITGLINQLIREFTQQNEAKLNMLHALLEILLIRASREYQQPIQLQQQNYFSAQIRKLESLIDAHYKELKLLADYANLMMVSPKQLNELSKKGLNKTVTSLIHERTLLEAKRLVLFTENTVKEIADNLGFSDKSYFLRFFKKQTGFTTEEFKKQHPI